MIIITFNPDIWHLYYKKIINPLGIALHVQSLTDFIYMCSPAGNCKVLYLEGTLPLNDIQISLTH